MAALCDVYVNDAFGTAHRAEATTHGIAQFAPIACAGPLLQAELEAYFQPFQAHLRKLFAMHRKCSLERAGKRKIAQQLGNALARAG